MLGKSTRQPELFRPLLSSFIDMGHELVNLGNKLEWDRLERSFSVYYSKTGTPSKPVRLMAGLLMLKQMFNHSDETLVEVWRQNPYYQYFTGGVHFQWELPCDASDLVHFRKRIGAEGASEIFALSVAVHADKVAKAKEVVVDTTVQEKNITFPTDTKLAVKVIAKCLKLAEEEGIKLRQTYRRTVKQELIRCRFAHHPKRRKEGLKAMRKLKTIAGRLVRDLDRKATGAGKTFFSPYKILYTNVLSQKRDDRGKIYSLHEPQTACIAKGKAHKAYEFGAKIGLATLPGSNVIVGVAHFPGNPHDSTTLEPTLLAAKAATGKEFMYSIVDRGYKGKKESVGSTVVVPNPKKDLKLNGYQKSKKRKQCRSRAAIEPIIAHVKHEHRMIRNFLKGEIGDKVNAIMAAAAFNLKKAYNELIRWLQFCLWILLWEIRENHPRYSNQSNGSEILSC